MKVMSIEVYDLDSSLYIYINVNIGLINKFYPQTRAWSMLVTKAIQQCCFDKFIWPCENYGHRPISLKFTCIKNDFSEYSLNATAFSPKLYPVHTPESYMASVFTVLMSQTSCRQDRSTCPAKMLHQFGPFFEKSPARLFFLLSRNGNIVFRQSEFLVKLVWPERYWYMMKFWLRFS